MVVLAVVNRSRFGCGLSQRIQRNLDLVRNQVNIGTATATGMKTVYTALLNPTMEDSLAVTSQLQLILGYGPDLQDSEVIADYLWFDSSPPSKLLPRVKNPINREGDRPPGESSVIGAFGARGGNMSTNR